MTAFIDYQKVTQVRLGGIGMITISAFKWVPDFARGQVCDLRVRWALEEAGLPYYATADC